MRKLMTIMAVLFCFVASAQYTPTGSKTRFTNGIGLGTKLDAAFGVADSVALYARADSSLMFKYKGTARALAYAGNIGAQIHDSLYSIYALKAGTSAGGRFISNGGSLIAEWGAGGGTNFDFHGFAGYNTNKGSSYTSRSFTDKNYVDSSRALDVQLAGTQTITGAKTFSLDATINGITAGKGASSLTNNTVFGSSAMGSITTGNNNTGFGFQVLRDNVTGGGNTAIGRSALRNNLASNNIGIGYLTMLVNSTGTPNLAIGNSAMNSNTTGGTNIAIGNDALYTNTTGEFNIGLGYQALLNSNTNYNIAIGVVALEKLTTGGSNIAMGASSLKNIDTGSLNIGIGVSAGLGLKGGMRNVVLGTDAGFDLTYGSNNTLVGYNTGRGITTGNYNSILGSNVTGLSGATSNNIILADGQGNIKGRYNGSWDLSTSITTPQYKLSALNTAPSSASDTGTLGEIRWDANYMYVCVATNTWKRSALTTW